MGGNDFEVRVVNSFKKIKEDFSNLEKITYENKKNIVINDNKLSSVVDTINEFSKKLDDIFLEINKMALVLNKIGTETSFIKGGRSSMGNKGEGVISSSNLPSKMNPIVSYGTSPNKTNFSLSIKDTKRSLLIKKQIMEFNADSVFLIELFDLIVNKKQLCSKTTFYRFINELSEQNNVEIFLENNKRKIRIKRKI
jgi:hypothetical protein